MFAFKQFLLCMWCSSWTCRRHFGSHVCAYMRLYVLVSVTYPFQVSALGSKKGDALIVEIYKIYKSHCNLDASVAGRMSFKNFLGNQYADPFARRFARRGADVWEYPRAMVHAITITRGRAWRIGLRLAAVTFVTAQAYNSCNTFKSCSPPVSRNCM